MKNLISNILLLLLFLVSSCGNKKEIVITNVYNGETGRSIYYDTEDSLGILFISDNFYLFNILDKTEDNSWIIVEQAPVFADSGRVETELQLYNIPEAREVILEDIDPSYSIYGSRFERKDDKDCLVIALKDGVNETTVLLTELLEKAKTVEPQETEVVSETLAETSQTPAVEVIPVSELKTVILLKIGTEEDQIGQGMAEQQLTGGKYNYVMPSYAVFDNQIFIIDAINFRVLAYDYSGNFVRKISYPDKCGDGSVNVVRDICVDKGVLYLSSFYAGVIYVVDSDTGDVIEIINGSDTQNKKFGSIELLALDNQKNLLIPDTWDNTLYVYGKANGSMKLLKTLPYTGKEQLETDTEGNRCTTKTNGKEVTVIDSEGNTVATFMFRLPAGSARIIDIDSNNYIYIQTFESQTPDSQSYDASYLKIIQDNGVILNDYSVPAWPNGPMTKHIVIDTQGTIFVATYDYTGAESPDDPPKGIIISKVN